MKTQPNAIKRRERRRPAYVPADPLLTAQEAALERAQGLSTFWRDVKNGDAPQPYYIGRKTPRWRLSAIRASIDACAKAKPQL